MHLHLFRMMKIIKKDSAEFKFQQNIDTEFFYFNSILDIFISPSVTYGWMNVHECTSCNLLISW